jgi:transcription elongation factor GreA
VDYLKDIFHAGLLYNNAARNMKTIYFTRKKYESIKKDYQKLLLERKDAVFHLTKAREMGDLSENGYYRSSKTRLSSIDFSLRKLSNFIRYGSVINFINNGQVEIGSEVIIQNNNKIQKFQIVGKEEADPSLGKISNESPLGKLLLGKKIRETVNLIVPSGTINYIILKIE